MDGRADKALGAVWESPILNVIWYASDCAQRDGTLKVICVMQPADGSNVRLNTEWYCVTHI